MQQRYALQDREPRDAEPFAFRADNTKQITVSVPMRPFVLIGGFSNCPAHFTGTNLIADLKSQRGAEMGSARYSPAIVVTRTLAGTARWFKSFKNAEPGFI